MLFTELQKLPCLQDEDYAAIALYMQCLAEQLDDTLASQADEFSDFLHRPAAAWVALATQIGIATGDLITPGPVSWQANWPVVLPVGQAPRLANLRGWWYVGANVNLTPDGGTTADSLLRIRMRITNGGVGLSNLADVSDLVYMSATTNGENLSVATTVFYPGTTATGATANPLINVELTHVNSSNMGTTLTPPFTVWVFYLGNTPEIAGA